MHIKHNSDEGYLLSRKGDVAKMARASNGDDRRLVDLLDPASRTVEKEREIANYLQKIGMPERHSSEELLYMVGFLAQEPREKNLKDAISEKKFYIKYHALG